MFCIPPVGNWMPYRWKLAFNRVVFRASDRWLSGSTTTFYTVQIQEDIDRLWRDGIPWPTQDIRANLGPGVYAWKARRDAEEYLSLLQPRRKVELRMIQFRVWNCCLRRFRSLDLNTLPEAEIESWMNRHSQLGIGPLEPHGYHYLQRAVGFRDGPEPAVEHYFHHSIFMHLWFYRE